MTYVGICFVPLLIAAALALLLKKNVSVHQVLCAIASGFLALIPISLLQLYVFNLPVFTPKTLAGAFLTTLIINGLIEETLKMATLFVIPRKDTTAGSFLILAMLQGFALGSFEAVIYLLSGKGDITLRLCTAAVIHALCAGLSGLFVWSISQKKTYVRPLLTAILMHGLYNYFASTTSFWWFSIITIAYTAIRLRFSHNRLSDHPTDDPDA